MIQQVNEVKLDLFEVLCCWLSKQHGSRLTIQEFRTPLDSFRVKQLNVTLYAMKSQGIQILEFDDMIIH
jgi:hypothetical protein